MQSIDLLCKEVIQAESISQEKIALDNLRQYIGKNAITLQIKVLNNNGNDTFIQELEEGQDFSTVTISFSHDSEFLTELKWKPKDKENVFSLLLE